jgi:glutamyl/glutaminyl-tRNA synthetase
VANAVAVWGLAAALDAKVLFRIEDHDRERSRAAYESAILEDLDWLGFAADAGPVRQHDDPTPYVRAADRLRAAGLIYACACTRSTFSAWAADHGSPWRGPGCPGGCRERTLTEEPWVTIRVALGDGDEAWDDRLLGRTSGPVTAAGDPAIRDRQGNWTYALCVVVDDLRQSISLVVRGEDLAETTPAQFRLARHLGRSAPAAFAHHRLIHKADGRKLSKADGDTAVHELRALGRRPESLIGQAAAAIGLLPEPRPIAAGDVGELFAARSG